jgi:biotin synthase
MHIPLGEVIISIRDRILAGGSLERNEALQLASAQGADLMDILAAANRVREHFRGAAVDICSIVNAKSGACSEDCRYCAQSSHYDTGAPVYPLIDPAQMEEAARAAGEHGARRFCIVTSGRGIEDAKDLENIARGIERVRHLGLSPCATLGSLGRDRLRVLRDAGLHRYHHNIETSREYYPEICSTHTFDDRVETLAGARELGLSICSGGILGMGENIGDRVSMAFSLRELDVDSVPINFLMPVAGTPFDRAAPLPPLEALQAIALFRLILPTKEIRICGGRANGLGSFHPFIFLAGADGFMIGNYLTRTGLAPEDDLRNLRDLGLEPSRP